MCTDGNHLDSQAVRQPDGVDTNAASHRYIHHVEGNYQRLVGLQQLRDEVEISAQVAGIEDGKYAMDPAAFIVVKEYVDSDRLIRRCGGETVRAWKVYEFNLNTVRQRKRTGLMLDGYTRVVTNALRQAAFGKSP